MDGVTKSFVLVSTLKVKMEVVLKTVVYDWVSQLILKYTFEILNLFPLR